MKKLFSFLFGNNLSLYTMKKFLVTVVVCLLSLSLQAKVGFVVPATNPSSVSRSDIPMQYSNKDGVDHTPEKMAYDWFKTEYVDQNKGEFLSINSLSSIDVVTYPVLWIYVDRELNNWVKGGSNSPFTISDFDALFNATTVGYLKSYVQAGGSIFLCKQATRLVYKIDRIDYAPEFMNDGYSDADRTEGIKGLIGSGLDQAQQSDRRSHAIYYGLSHGTMGEQSYPLLTVDGSDISTWNGIGADGFVEYYSYDKDCAGDLCKRHKSGDNGIPNNDINSKNIIDWWEYYWKAEALGVRADIGDYCYFMAAEFKPGYTKCGTLNEFKGTVITMGSAAYQWGDNKGVGLSNVQKLTSNSLAYLESLRPLPENPGAETVFLLLDNLSKPEQNAKQWFIDNYILKGKGRFVAASDLSSIPACVKNIIVHADRTPLYDWTTNSISSNLTTWVKAGGNLVLLCQATMLAYNMGRISYSPWNEALETGVYPTGSDMNQINVNLGTRSDPDPAIEPNSMGQTSVDRSGDKLYAGLTPTPGKNNSKLISLFPYGTRFNNRCYWQEMLWRGDDPSVTEDRATESRARFDQFETRFNCTVLAVEAPVYDFCLASIIRFKGATSGSTYVDWNGTILAIGAGGFQYADDNSSLYGENGVMTQLVENAIRSMAPIDPCANCFIVTFR